MWRTKTIFCSSFIIIVLTILHKVPQGVESSPQGDLVDKWAKKLGKELYNLGQVITKNQEIESRYRANNAQVLPVKPNDLLSNIVTILNRMMDRKMDAIRCIQQKAEEKAEEFQFNGTDVLYSYFSSKYSQIEGEEEEEELPESLQDNSEMYLNMILNNDTHFYNIPVNTSYSSVHVPTNIYDRHKDAQIAIQWSAALDEVFRRNYNSDPALSWQYFGSYSGIMRHYPAMRWIKQKEQDLFDCRIRTWYIEAATCTKDVIILVDNSGSMQGMMKHIASLTVYSILDTFSNNDYINVLNYSTTVDYVVPCFKKILVQATPENVETFKSAVQILDPHDKSNVREGLNTSLQILSDYRNKRGCNENSTDCNQAIMLITDGLSSNLTDLLDTFNRLSNGSKIPVRLFTYLIGSEVAKVEEITWLACNNRGYFSRVATLEQVTSAVLNYINVIARPLVLTGVETGEHPVSWTHAYIDLTYDGQKQNEINEPYRLLTSVAIPAYDRKVNKNNESREAQLLGVAATDVPIDEFKKLSFPYKIGVNAHAFMVSNNGYILMHPGLRPFLITKAGKHIKPNYNSVDLTEVQQLDDGSEPRSIGKQLLELRDALVNGSKGQIYNVSLKYHYDNMRRVSKETFDFYYTPLEDTPFSIALAFPNKFGHFAVKVQDEIKRNRHTGYKLTSFFQGSNWKIHPKWVYCKYHYLEGHEFDTPENELLHFLKRMYDPEFKWAQQYEATKRKTISENDVEGVEEEFEDITKVECGRKTLRDDDYYCDKELIKLLIFDAKSTKVAFDEPWSFKNNRESRLFHRYNSTLRFVATMSGLTRWEYIFGEGNNTITEFGDLHARAIDETWYKSAVLQHQYDKQSFVYSVPHNPQSEDILVTSSYAIFPKDAGYEAPASVVGFQMSHSAMTQSFFELANADNSFCTDCVACGDLLDCYIIDSSGYIIISHNPNDTGKFFGEIEGSVLETMLTENLFEKIQIYDYQALCDRVPLCVSDGNILLTPLAFLNWATNWILGKMFWMLIRMNLHQLWDPYWVLTNPFDDIEAYTEKNYVTTTEVPISDLDDEPDNTDEDFEKTGSEKWEEGSGPYPCDQKKDLYILNQYLLIRGSGFTGEFRNTSRPFYAKRIPYSNLLLVAINATFPNVNQKKYTTLPEIIRYAHTCHSCQKLNLNNLTRRRLQGCFNEHVLEHEIKDCGGSGSVKYLSNLPIIYFAMICVQFNV